MSGGQWRSVVSATYRFTVAADKFPDVLGDMTRKGFSGTVAVTTLPEGGKVVFEVSAEQLAGYMAEDFARKHGLTQVTAKPQAPFPQ